MKKIIVLFSCFLLMFTGIINSFAISCDQLPPKTQNAVNDFANLIDPGRRTELESQLREYWNKTSIAVVVVTVDTMNGYNQFDYSTSLYNCWGIGDLTSRGVLIFVSKNERKISIRSGKGIEYLVTDGKSGKIRDAMIGLFKQGDLSYGIDYGVQQVIELMGTMSWSDRMAAIAQQKLIEETQNRERINVVTNAAIVVSVLALIAFLFIVARKAYIKDSKKKIIKDANDKIRKEIINARDLLIKTAVVFKNAKAPEWAMQEGREHNKLILKAIEDAENFLKNSDGFLIKSDIFRAQVESNQAGAVMSKAFENFKKIDQGLWQKIKTFADNAPKKLELAKTAVDDAITCCDQYKEYVTEVVLQEVNTLFSQISFLLSEKNDSEKQKHICETTDLIAGKANKISSGIKLMVETKMNIDNYLERLREKAISLQGRIDEVSKILGIVKVNYSQSVWEQLQADYSRYVPVLDPNLVNSTLVEILRLNSLEVKDFVNAKNQYELLIDRLNKTEKVFLTIVNVENAQCELKKNYTILCSSVIKAVEVAIQLSKDSDVSVTTRAQVKKVISDLKQIEHDATMAIVDWSILYNKLSDCNKSADNSIRLCRSDISNAENERQKIAQEKRRRQEESTRQNFELYNSFKPKDDSNSATGNFDGYRGGTTNGGGADGSW